MTDGPNSPPAAVPDSDQGSEGDGSSRPQWLPPTRATAFAVLCMLSFGVIAGSLVKSNPESRWRRRSPGEAKTCRAPVLDLTQLTPDLKNASKTPSLSYIVPSPCDDGSEVACAYDAEDAR